MIILGNLQSPMNSHRQIARGVSAFLEETRGMLTPQGHASADDLLQHGEWGEAYLLIVTQLYEYEVPIQPSLYGQIKSLGQQMKLKPTAWEPLRELMRRS